SINPSEYKRRVSNSVEMIGGKHVPVVFADFMHVEHLTRESLSGVGYNYDAATDKWNLKDTATDFIYTGKRRIPFALPGTLKVVLDFAEWQLVKEEKGYYPLFQYPQLIADVTVLDALESLEYTFVAIDTFVTKTNQVVAALQSKKNIVLCLYSSSEHAMACVRDFVFGLEALGYKGPLVLVAESSAKSIDAQLIDFSRNAGTLFLDGIGDGVWLMNEPGSLQNLQMKGRTYLPVTDNNQFLNNTSFSILQATRTRISKTEYISCPSCGRTLFDLQETTSRIRSVTNHLKGVKIAIMGCIVNGPGEMADADYGYVGSGPGKITLYKSKEVVKKGLSSYIAVQELIQLIKDNGDWTEPVN
ncbi:MAG: 4-hydroxy-3-methylbut-2-en-yl diphosphate synthase, partial [Bacteroidota bacterium]